MSSQVTSFRLYTIRRNFQNCSPLLVPKSKKKFLASTPSPHDFFDLYWPPELCPTRENAKIKSFFAKRNFSFFALFSPFSNSTQSEFGRYKNEFKHCPPLTMVSLASAILTVPILVPNLSEVRTWLSIVRNFIFPSIPIFTTHLGGIFAFSQYCML